MFVDGRKGLEWVQDRVVHCGGTLAIAFWGRGAIEKLRLADREPDAGPIRIVCNLALGGTNPFEIERMMGLNGITVQQSDRLHGKVYLFDGEVMIGSSNASANGLSFEGVEADGWNEANLVSNDSRTLVSVRDWLSRLPVRIIGPDDIDRAKLAWHRRRQAGPALERSRSIVDVLADGEAAVSGRRVYLAVYAGNMSGEGEKAVADMRQETNLPIDAFEDWDGIPKDGIFLLFRRGSRGGLYYEDCGRRRPDWPDQEAGTGYSLQWYFNNEEVPLGLMPPSDDPGWRQVIDLVLKYVGPVNDSAGQWVKFEDLARFFATSRRQEPGIKP